MGRKNQGARYYMLQGDLLEHKIVLGGHLVPINSEKYPKGRDFTGN